VQTTNGGAPYVINCYAIQSDTINYQHDWQFGGSIPYLGNSISYSVENAGIYTVCHTLANSQTGCLDTICKVITVVPDTATFLCVADFNYSVSSTNILRMLFNNESLPNAGTNYVWSFGDNTTGNQPNPEHTFPSSGIYNVCVTMTNGTCTDTRCMEVAVGQLPNDCEAAFTFSPSMNNPLRILFTNQSTSGDSANYYWNFEGGSSAFSFNAERTFPVAGIYEVCLYTYSANCQDSICKQVSVGQPGGDCSAEFVINGFASASPATLQFIPSTNQQGTHEWFFSNGIVVNGVSPTLIFSDTGNYNVCHVFTSTQSNCTDTICKEFTVGPNAGGGFTIAGQVFAGANYADWARVKLLRFDPVSLAAIVVSETYTDSGYYSFPGIEAGIYLVKAALLENSNYYSNYVPTYFGSQYYWFNAEPINLLSNGWSYNISLIYASNPGGPGTIGGNINDDPFRISAGGVNPVSNADIIITSTQDEPQRWTVSDLNGEFNVSNLAYGTYRLFADLAGQICIPVEFTLSEDVPSVNIALSLGDGITGIVEPVFATLQGELFPNPTSRSSQLSLNLKETERLRFKLLDVTGKSIWENTQLLNPGKQTITIPVDGIGSGIYILSVIGEDNRVVGSRKLTVIP